MTRAEGSCIVQALETLNSPLAPRWPLLRRVSLLSVVGARQRRAHRHWCAVRSWHGRGRVIQADRVRVRNLSLVDWCLFHTVSPGPVSPCGHGAFFIVRPKPGEPSSQARRRPITATVLARKNTPQHEGYGREDTSSRSPLYEADGSTDQRSSSPIPATIS